MANPITLLRRNTGRRIEDGGAGPFNVTASFGIADARDCDYDLLQLLKTADQRLYAAKRAGGNRVVAG